MTTYYTKGEDGEYSEADTDSMFKERHKRWVDTESKKIREEVEASTREDLTATITTEVEDRVKGEFQSKLDEAAAGKKELEVQLRQKTIAAEYGFKPGTEKYLGTGSEDEMRKEADNLKNNFVTSSKPPEKKTPTGESVIQQRTGIKVEV